MHSFLDMITGVDVITTKSVMTCYKDYFVGLVCLLVCWAEILSAYLGILLPRPLPPSLPHALQMNTIIVG